MISSLYWFFVDLLGGIVYRLSAFLYEFITGILLIILGIWITRSWFFASRLPKQVYTAIKKLVDFCFEVISIYLSVCAALFMGSSQFSTGIIATLYRVWASNVKHAPFFIRHYNTFWNWSERILRRCGGCFKLLPFNYDAY
jgi:hypothetical protein